MQRTETETEIVYTNTGSAQSHTKPIFYITGAGDDSTDVMKWNRMESNVIEWNRERSV